ncbi:hypothetical protein [Variovorax sp. ZT4R33]|uniref:hypothetical protein n=1 Tax=Variovorax sp. ZT4R33 TaxID=3443743 RepID=UPI003F4618C6
MTSHPQGSPAERARQVIGLTSNAWQVSPYNPHAQARRAPYGYVPLRTQRRLQSAAARSAPGPHALAHSW